MILIMPLVAGLDAGRFKWSNLGIQYSVIGTVLYVAALILVQWAMLVNPFFETTVRIQKDRDQKVVTAGPYEFVRHPGYVGTILSNFAAPFIIGSAVTLIPAMITFLLFIIRAALEDRTLQNELGGYREYAQKVRYRLLPGVW
jgi:protein-S-isoprenylcysteine O-methyltransferase Ste14